MKLLTVSAIIEILKKEEIPVTQEKFNYYSKIGLLFSAEKKIKKKVKEGIKSFYAEELVDRIRKVYRLKDEGHALEEIKDILFKGDKDYVCNIYKEAGVSINPPTDAFGPAGLYKPDCFVESKVSLWREIGYYKGLLNIYTDIIGRLKDRYELISKIRSDLDSLRSDIIKKIGSSRDKGIIGEYANLQDKYISIRHEKAAKESLEIIKHKYKNLLDFLDDNNVI
jgi:DNA-binding transcriptional MerR regulator